ncbi:S26 family signal peptidase [Candidatus Phytoplasma melaleucae]|uniref:S26 family signal peptidase n=1 Tax=Candidatus Phytoplasma melaleucae TaxID=2982630 RepID=A0ABT9DDV6_9MOLU|nr:S26 family signal peptidase ['Melaleuca sp.' phytoplasma]MDO8168213.1 S26 family signal peptidase ['Melaleuca sp.' phytoplasma]
MTQTKNIKKNFNLIKLAGNILFHISNLVLLYMILVSLGNFFLPEKITMKIFPFTFCNVASNSMWPTMKANDIVIVKAMSPEQCIKLKQSNKGEKNGDIIVFKVNPHDYPTYFTDILYKNHNAQTQRVIHRVIDNNQEKKYLQTQGDNNEAMCLFEKKIPYQNILYKHLLTIPNEYLKIISFILLLGFIISIIFLP